MTCEFRSNLDSEESYVCVPGPQAVFRAGPSSYPVRCSAADTVRTGLHAGTNAEKGCARVPSNSLSLSLPPPLHLSPPSAGCMLKEASNVARRRLIRARRRVLYDPVI
jgi:hypothetical protein